MLYQHSKHNMLVLICIMRDIHSEASQYYRLEIQCDGTALTF